MLAIFFQTLWSKQNTSAGIMHPRGLLDVISVPSGL